MNLHDLFAIPLARDPGKVALRFRSAEGTVQGFTYAELFAAARRVAGGFAARGLGRGDRIAFFLGNRPEFVIAYLAALELGAVVVPMNLAYRRTELEHLLSDAQPSGLLSERELAPVLADVPGLPPIVWAEELGELAAAPNPLAPLSPPLAAEESAFLLYTSGTTGKSKGARMSHGNLVATVTALLAAWDWSARDVLLLCLPLFHTHGLVVGLHNALAAGATVELRRRFQVAEAADDLLAGAATMFFGVPTMYVRLVEELAGRGDLSALRAMRLFCSGSAPLAPETFEAFERLTGHSILERYGMTETGMILSNPYAGKRRPGSVGTELPGVEVRIVDGELQVRGANVFDGYWNTPEKTAESFVDGWFRTGDLARRDPETGAITLLGRRCELILCGGYNVYPREIEELLLTHPGIREAAVVGRPDPDLGQVPVAFLVSDSEIDPEALRAWCKERIAGFKVPRRFVRRETLPRNALGKIQKGLLED
ncbi:MAG: acyl-CoA synthetase [Thermoanaerobaculia bacterium]|nr:acyl-CoA synthetase [Thermoanaerobaculia bacterium]